MRIITLLLLLAITGIARAEVYKCATPTKQIIYQPTPCASGTENKNIVVIEKLNPQQLEDAQNRLKATEAERQALDKAEQERREADEARQAVEAEKREAAAARQQAETMNNPYPVYIPYPNYNYRYPSYNYNYPQRPVVNPYLPTRPLNPSFVPYPEPNPSFSPYPSSPYPAPYMPWSPAFPTR
jgi:hypothetical protein